MSFQNFKAKIWSKAIDTDLKLNCVYAEDTNQKYTGEIGKLGDTVRIQGVGKPQVTDHLLKNGDIVLSNPEKVADTSVSLVVDHAAWFNYAVEDIDKAQGAGKVLQVLNQEASEEVAAKMDTVIANLANETVGVQRYKSGNTVLTKDNILFVLDECQQMLFEQNVSPATEIVVTMAPWIFTIFRQAYERLDQDNSTMLKNGKVAMYAGMTIKMSNNVAKNASGHSMMQVKTKRAIAFAQGKPHVEPYRPENGFKDAVKGFVLYGTKIVRPKEMVVVECSATADTNTVAPKKVAAPKVEEAPKAEAPKAEAKTEKEDK